MTSPGGDGELILLARLETEVRALTATVERLETQQTERWNQIMPLLMERSGDVERSKKAARDVNNLGEAMRLLDRRVDVVERQQARTVWTVAGAVFVIQALALLIPWLKENVF